MSVQNTLSRRRRSRKGSGNANRRSTNGRFPGKTAGGEYRRAAEPPLPAPTRSNPHDARDPDVVLPALSSAGTVHSQVSRSTGMRSSRRIAVSRSIRPSTQTRSASVRIPSAALHGSTSGSRPSFGLGERDWWSSELLSQIRRIPRLLAGVTFVAVTAIVAFIVASLATASIARTPILSAARATQPPDSSSIVQQVSTSSTPTPVAPAYQIGVWVSEYSPPASGSIDVFVRVTHDVAPEGNQPVYLVVTLPSGSARLGPTMTDSYGVATFHVSYGYVPPEQPVFVVATTTIQGQILSANTVFVPQ